MILEILIRFYSKNHKYENRIEREKIMNKRETQKIEKLMNEFEFDFIFNEENQKYQLSKKNYNELLEFLNDNEEERKNINIDNFEVRNQIHIKRNKDIKIDAKKIDNYNLKMIYHRKNDNSLEYRIFIAFKNEAGELKRIRMINEEIKKIHSDEKMMREYFNKLEKKNQIEKYLKEKIS